ncbi:uncharacterized protein LTHEOB_1457 [Lasiodiplodia theobromae]|uniref:uncharacterized protein n=1 Tax=Lasiodiplodia theobromae TaxID=45133 RepID=UPI0015C2CE86|nr:uncharacterized protein LTHEOB_1457 [Lasiodiplodia theobromae]KAF4537266.1 hypothetical protein LTHEOB_1457 [Lasiodiplodia theobromae]
MTSRKIYKTVGMGKGLWMDITVDESLPEDSIDRWTTCVFGDGKPGSEVFTVPPHWHKNHSEYITVVEGRVAITLDGKTQVVQGGDPAIFIPARHTHSMKSFPNEKVTLEEKVVPAGAHKAQFFYDLLQNDTYPGFWHAMRSFYDGDTYVPLPGNIGLIDEAFMFVMGNLAKLLAPSKAKL